VLSIIILGILGLYDVAILYIALKSKERNEKSAFLNNLSLFIILSFGLVSNFTLISLRGLVFIVFPFDFLIIFFVVIFLPSFYLAMIKEKKKMRNKNRFYITRKEKQNEIPLKYDIYRKLTHLIVLGIILFYFTLGFLLQNFFYYIFLTLPDLISSLVHSLFIIEDGNIMIFTQYLVTFLVGISFIGLSTADFARILKPDLYPLKPVNQILRERELNTRLGPHISMAVGCFSIILIYGLYQPLGPLIICTSVTISIFADISSNLIGRTIGKNNIRKTKKTYEGLIAGIIGAFISGFLILIILEAYKYTSFSNLILLSICGSLIIGILDYLDLEIDDNLTYPVILSTILYFISVLVF
jgi:CDP-diglyceride synthetase